MDRRKVNNSQGSWTLEDFEIKRSIGKGRFGHVKIAIEKASRKTVAIKIQSKKEMSQNKMLLDLRRETEIHTRLNHINLVRCFGYFQDKKNFYIVMEYAGGSSLFQFLRIKTKINTQMIRILSYQILGALVYLHERKVIHRDLKLENILLKRGRIVKLCDFGWSTIAKDDIRGTFCGTLLYLSPERIRREKYDCKVDLWCLGIIIYELAFNAAPFLVHSDKKATESMILKCELWQLQNFKLLSKPLQNLLLKLLDKNPEKRASAKEALSMPFFDALKSTGQPVHHKKTKKSQNNKRG